MHFSLLESAGKLEDCCLINSVTPIMKSFYANHDLGEWVLQGYFDIAVAALKPRTCLSMLGNCDQFLTIKGNAQIICPSEKQIL